MLSDDRIPPDPTPQPAEAPRCEAPGCTATLSPAQLRKGARSCSPGCRVRAHRERAKAARLAEIDAAIATLGRLRAEVAARG